MIVKPKIEAVFFIAKLFKTTTAIPVGFVQGLMHSGFLRLIYQILILLLVLKKRLLLYPWTNPL
ncbi:hypothetical protein MADE_1000845 [Alteromonas mediterranea DE]|uniref:Uncharacterized protein n=1 Tax=Alteromonas mediterranea (strain DSM 17117 / CIP 110805 / LMG 28347 / Deep ecotype) TaxID=1774373 RepID=F2G2V8_ALTMD|nr:hypothetical protein MADE_1000845 [Alteromonas mediterranea DE]